MLTADLSGRSAIVTGGASGIGLEIARRFAAAGARVGVIDRAALPPGQTALAFARCDVTEPEAVARSVAALTGEIGPATILVNCAGIDEIAPLEAISLAQWNRMLAVHLTGSFLVTQAVLPMMRAAGWGRIINLSSQLGHRGAAGMVPYCTAKAGIMGFTRALAHEVAGQGITVNCLNPGPIDTPLVASLPADVVGAIVAELPLRRLGTVDEVAVAALMLASDEGGFFLGASLNMNGGHYMI